MSDSAGRWQFWIDVGGTFTDCVARRPDGSVATYKLLSTGVYKGVIAAESSAATILDPERRHDPARFFDGFQFTAVRAGQVVDGPIRVARFDAAAGTLQLDRPLRAARGPGMTYELASGEDAPVTGIRWLLGKRLDEPVGPVEVRLGTTRGTNALLERQGAATALVTTSGFRDVLRIAYQNRPRLFDLDIRLPTDLYSEVVELNERMDAGGNVLLPIDSSEVRAKLAPLKDCGIVSLAVCLMNSYRNAAHERVVERIAHELGFEQVSVSTRLSPLQKIVPRGDTTVVDAYLTPIIRDYVASIAAKIPDGSLKLMTSAGSLADAGRFVGKDSILSGPAGGVVGYAHVARNAGFERAIGFDMGGTSTDVSRFDGEYERRYEMEVNDPTSGRGVRVVAPMLAIETVAAGGGSICWFDGQKPVVGPRSAGANPGPASYGRGGPLTVTDVNLFLGKVLPRHFPFPLDRAAVEARLDQLIDAIDLATGQRYTREKLAAGFTAIANANMVAPIKKISIARGYDARDYTLVSFGGAGAQHACAIARELGMRRILLNRLAGVLSAFGIGMADVSKFGERAIGERYEASNGALQTGQHARLNALCDEMAAELRQQVLAEGIPPDRVARARRLLDLRYVGQDSCITVAEPADGDYRAEFERLHRQLYGFTFPDRAIEIHAVRVEVRGETDKPPVTRRAAAPHRPAPNEFAEAYFDGRYWPTSVYLRDQLAPGACIDGPAIIAEPISTIVVEPGWVAEVTETDDVLLTARDDNGHASGAGGAGCIVTDDSREVDAIQLELFNNHFASIAEQMGATLQKTSLSTNVKERLDFSCAIFTASGDLVVNAPHIPVHLGAMSECVKRLIEDVPDMRPGEVYVTNDPFRGGSHLPDVTVVTPVFTSELSADRSAGGREDSLCFTASRAHHAEIGGITPGSMPPFSKSLAEEGVLIRHFRLVQSQRSSEDELRRLLSDGPHPSRSVHENIADVNAQVAANQIGVAQLLAMVDRYGIDVVRSYMRHIQRAAENKMRRALAKISAGEHRFCDTLDDGSPVVVTITVRHIERDDRREGEAIVDFAGTGPVLAGNLNANSAIVSSAVIYCFRCLIDEAIPLNAGILAPIEIRLPASCLLNPPSHADPSRCPAVVGGNVETSQRVVDVIFGALGVVAASQGTMNNFLFGRSASGARSGFGYYETICGGAGAGPGFAGADAVHTHMTNTRLTDPEVLEARYPVRVRRFEIRRGSGGAGQCKGGDGIIRAIEFLEPLEVSLLTSRRTTRPYGLSGAESGAGGRNVLVRRSTGRAEDLPGATHIRVDAGDVLEIHTPGGGGWGKASPM
jgi:5-oxoprolinase (ATP-hydrolysing)